MADEISGESLPLSQESFRQLMNQLNFTFHPHNVMNDATSLQTGILSNMDSNFLEHINEWSSNLHVPAPAMENWPGDYLFRLSFYKQERCKSVSWFYCSESNKLYVKKDVPCPFNFSTDKLMTDNVYIRARAYFSSPDHAVEVVHRCLNHSMEEIQNKILEAEHLVRCENNLACYEIDKFTGHHSVIVPFANPAVGQSFTSYIYKFGCYTSCSGGPNRRPMTLVFTLEKGNTVIGRQKVDIKICAAPGRDSRLQGELPKAPKIESKKHKISSSESMPPAKKIAKNETYWIEVPDKKCYKFLCQMKKYYYMIKLTGKQLHSNLFSTSGSELSSDEKNTDA